MNFSCFILKVHCFRKSQRVDLNSLRTPAGLMVEQVLSTGCFDLDKDVAISRQLGKIAG